MIVSPPLYPYHHHHASGWPPRFYESQVSNTKIQVHFVRTCWCQRLRHSCREKKNHRRALFITWAMSWFGFVWAMEFSHVFPTLSNFKRTPHSSINSDDFCDNRVTIVDQRVTDPSGSEKASWPTNTCLVSCLINVCWKLGNQTKRWLIVRSIWCQNINLPWENKSSLENGAVKETIRQWFGISLAWTTSFFSNDPSIAMILANQTGTSKLQAFHKWVRHQNTVGR